MSKIKSRMRAVQGWVTLYFGRATGNRYLESKGMAGRTRNNLRQRSGKIRKMLKR
ncbi:hypothetical protein AB0K40_08955 [Nonomuraea bangladeshensis]|uniref:CsbD family protein n=1 Tax=Nonomuraea bangladeshensis TaxID=404385 RepID=A0ABV3GZC1_9ACTN